MLMPLMCSECAVDELAAVGNMPAGGLPVRVASVPVQSSGLYRGVCPRGHKILLYADFQPFELLFESAMEAFVDAYFRESVGSFAAALERYYEFSIATLMLKDGLSIEDFTKTWKPVSKQSERQLGMYIGIYTVNFRAVPSILTDEQANFRNNVIHKGHFPSPDEAAEFGEAVYKIISTGIRELRSHCDASMQQARQIARNAAAKQVGPNEVCGTFGMGTTVSLLVLDEPPPLKEALGRVAARLARQRVEAASLPPR